MEIVELSERLDLKEEAINYFWKCWGNESNFIFYKDCIEHSLNVENPIPKFYLGLQENKIIASYALLANDIISRQDLIPWFACLFVNPAQRKKGYAEQLLNHAIKEAKTKGFDKVYLSTDLENFYERKGWVFKCEAYGVGGDPFNVYERKT